MNYIGSKQKLSNFIIKATQDVVGDISTCSVCDLFSGTGSIAHAFSTRTNKVIANDVEKFSYIWIKHLLNGSDEKLYKDYVDKLNKYTKVEKGLFSEHFSEFGDEKRLYFTKENAKKIDTIRSLILSLEKEESLNPYLVNSLLASLIDATDRVANTASVYGSYLKRFKFTAKQELKLQVLPSLNDDKIQVFNEDGKELLTKISGDILYLDPPYNHRQYGLNYHVLNALVKYPKFNVKGKSGLGEYFRSRWCQKRYVVDELEETIKRANFRYIFLSYNDEGLLSDEQFKKSMEKFGRYTKVQTSHSRLRMNDKTPKKDTIESLHILEKNEM